MPNEKVFVDYIMEQLHALGDIKFRRMFGEATLYHEQKVVGMICNNQLFIKATEAGREFLGEVREAPAYKGAKNSFLIDNVDNKKSLCELVRRTAAELPMPRKKKVVMSKK